MDEKNSINESIVENKSEIKFKEKIEPSDEIKILNENQNAAENQKNFFHVTTKYKWIFAVSIIILIVTGVLIYAKFNEVLAAEYWQMAIWGVCSLLSFYAIFKKSLAAMLFNLILFFGISLLPAWGLVYQFLKPLIDLFLGTE